MTVLIVVPVFNEAETVGRVVEAAREYGPVLVVDDGSRDGSGEVARRAGAEVIRHAAPRQGRGAAPGRRGARTRRGRSGDARRRRSTGRPISLVLDAARAAPDDRDRRAAGRCGRAAAGPAQRDPGRGLLHELGLRAQAVLTRRSGFRVYPIELFDDIRVRRGGFVFETEVLVAGVARGWGVHEVPVAALTGCASGLLPPDQRRRRDRDVSVRSRARPLGARARDPGRRAGEAVLRRAPARAPPGHARASVDLHRVARALGDVRRELGDPARAEPRGDVAARSASAARWLAAQATAAAPVLLGLLMPRPSRRGACRLRVAAGAVVLFPGSTRRGASEPRARRESGRAAVVSVLESPDLPWRSCGDEIAAGASRLSLHGHRHRDRRRRARRARRDERAHRPLHRGRRPLRARSDLGGRAGHGHGARGSPPAGSSRRPRSGRSPEVPGVQGVQAQISSR